MGLVRSEAPGRVRLRPNRACRVALLYGVTPKNQSSELFLRSFRSYRIGGLMAAYLL
jgi:hypothetical protein